WSMPRVSHTACTKRTGALGAVRLHPDRPVVPYSVAREVEPPASREDCSPMFLALKEMARAKVRFALLIAAIGLLVFLILFQQSLQNGLLTSFVGAIRNQSAPVLVYTVDGQRVIQG